MDFHIKKSRFSVKPRFKKSKCAADHRGRPLNREFTVLRPRNGRSPRTSLDDVDPENDLDEDDDRRFRFRSSLPGQEEPCPRPRIRGSADMQKMTLALDAKEHEIESLAEELAEAEKTRAAAEIEARTARDELKRKDHKLLQLEVSLDLKAAENVELRRRLNEAAAENRRLKSLSFDFAGAAARELHFRDEMEKGHKDNRVLQRKLKEARRNFQILEEMYAKLEAKCVRGIKRGRFTAKVVTK